MNIFQAAVKKSNQYQFYFIRFDKFFYEIC